MKTFWLEGHLLRPPAPRPKPNHESLEDNLELDIPLPLEALGSERSSDEKDKRIYSPITFHDVRARFSISEMSVGNNFNKAKGKII